MNLLEQWAGEITEASRMKAIAESMKTAAISALTLQQQLAISAKIMGDLSMLPTMLVAWLKTEPGQAAVRELVDKFTGTAS